MSEQANNESLRATLAGLIGLNRLTGGLLLGLLVFVADRFFSPLPYLEEVPPLATPYFLLRSAALAAGSWLLWPALRDEVQAVTTTSASSRRWDRTTPSLAAGARLGLLLSLFFAVLVVFFPGLLAWLVEEDSVVEWLSALFSFGAGLLALGAAWRWYRASRVVLALVVTGFAGIFLLLGLEEISWFQRVLGLPTPDFFEGNRQQEINFHNFATEFTAHAFFVVAALFGVLLPYLLAGRELPGRLARFSVLVPPRLVLYSTLFAAALTYKMWNVFHIQLTFWLSLVVVLTDRLPAGQEPLRRAAALGLLLTLAAYLFFGANMGRSMDAEIREMIIPLGLLAYAYTLYRRRPA